MRALFGLSLWIALATVIPGLITIAAVGGAVLTAGALVGVDLGWADAAGSDWFIAAVAIAIMVLTQALGILLEEGLVRLRLLGPALQKVHLPHFDDETSRRSCELRPYEEYAGLYMHLAGLHEGDDAHGHVRRAAAQFFLTNNSLVAFVAGLAVTLGFITFATASPALWYYAGALLLCLLVSYVVAVLRFREMAKSLWAVRHRFLFSTGEQPVVTEAPVEAEAARV